MQQNDVTSSSSVEVPARAYKTKLQSLFATGSGKEIFCGTLGGIASVIVGQPFDLVKVRMQTSLLA